MPPPDRDVLVEIVARLRAAAQPERIILFGSQARGMARPHSDYVAVICTLAIEGGC